MSRPADLIDPVLAAARRAGEVILRHYAAGVEVERKADASPVTVADREAEAAILPVLAELLPDVPIVAEEEVAAGNVPAPAPRFWLVDALDGTREFLSRNGEFTVNVALIEDGRPVLGVVHLPARGETYYAAGPGTARRRLEGGRPEPIAARPAPADGLVVLVSRRHGSNERLAAFLETVPVKERVTAGSSLKFCLIAAGEADLYPRFGPTSEWDIAAGHAVLAAAGGSVRTLDGAEMTYGKPDYRNPEFIARGA